MSERQTRKPIWLMSLYRTSESGSGGTADALASGGI